MLSRNFLGREGTDHKSRAFRHLTWEPIAQTLENLNALIREENPLTLKYLYFATHDLYLVHMLSSLGYYSDEDDPTLWQDVRGVSFNASLRFEIYETTLSANDSLDS